MPLSLDEIDVSILKSILEDGRKSFRQISRDTGITTPTVKARRNWCFATSLVITGSGDLKSCIAVIIQAHNTASEHWKLRTEVTVLQFFSSKKETGSCYRN